MIKAVIFDRDGVFVDAEVTHMNSVVQTFKELGIMITEDERLSVVSRHPSIYVHDFAKKYTFDTSSFLDKQRENYITSFKEGNYNLFPEIVALARDLKSQGYLIGLTTSSDTETTDAMIQRDNLEDLFDAIVTADDCSLKKPDPMPYRLTLQKLGISSNEAVVIEDSGTGVQSAVNAGITTIAYPNEYTKNHDFSAAQQRISQPSDVYAILSRG